MADDPKSTIRVDGDTSGAQDSVNSLQQTFGGLFGVLAGATAAGFGLGVIAEGLSKVKDLALAPYEAVKNLVEGFADAGDKIFTLSQQTGQSAEALSTYKYIADQTGASLEGISAATFKMSVNIAKGGKQTEQAFKDIGTSAKELRTLAPEEQFAKIMEGLSGIPDAGQRAMVGVQIFGKGFQGIAQLANEDLKSLTDNAKTFGLVMSDEMAAAGDTFGDTLSDISSIMTGLKNTIGAALLPIVNSFIGTLRDELVVAFKMVKDVITPLFGGVNQFGKSLTDAGKSAQAHELILKGLVNTVAFVIRGFAELIRSGADVAGMYYDLRMAGNFLLIMFGKLVEGALWSAQQIAIGMGKISFGETRKSFQRDADELAGKLEDVRADINNLGEATTDLFTKKMKVTSELVNFSDKLKTASTELRNQAAAYKGTATEADAASPKVKGFSDDIGDVGEKAKKTKEELNEFQKTTTVQLALLRQEWYQQTPAVRANVESIGILLDKYMALRSKVTDPSKLPRDLELLAVNFGRLHGPLLGTQHDLDEILKSLPQVSDEVMNSSFKAQQAANDAWEHLEVLAKNAEKIDEERIAQTQRMREEAKKLAVEGFDRLANSLMQIQQIAPGALGTVASAIGTMMGVAKTAVGAIGDIKNAIMAAKSGEVLASFGSIATGIGGIISAATVAIGLFKKLFGAEGRKTVEEFAAEHGGFDALHNELLALGDQGEAFWIKLTQGVGRNNPEQARQVIEEITAALEAQKKKQDEVTDVTEETAVATIETATQASQALDTLGDKLNANKDAWKDWSSVVMGYIGNVGDSLRALSTQVSNLPAYSGGGSVNTGEGIAASRGGGSVVFQEGAIQVDRPILKDRESMQELTAGIGQEMKNQFGSQGLW